MRALLFLSVVACMLAAGDEAEGQLFRRRVSVQRPAMQCSGGQCFVVPIEAPQVITPVSIPPVMPAALIYTTQIPEGPDESGVDWDKISRGNSDSLGNSLTLIEAAEFAAGDHKYSKDRFRLVVIGTPDERRPVKEAFDRLELADRELVAPWFVAADHWSLLDPETKEPRFEAKGKPTVYLLAPDGASISRQDGWTGAQDMEAIRRALKKYDSKKDVDARKLGDGSRRPLLAFLNKIDKLTLLACVCGLGGLLLFALKGKA